MIAASVSTFTAASMFQGQNWCAKCSVCGAIVTKYCFTEDEARREAESEPHTCKSRYSGRPA